MIFYARLWSFEHLRKWVTVTHPASLWFHVRRWLHSSNNMPTRVQQLKMSWMDSKYHKSARGAYACFAFCALLFTERRQQCVCGATCQRAYSNCWHRAPAKENGAPWKLTDAQSLVLYDSDTCVKMKAREIFHRSSGHQSEKHRVSNRDVIGYREWHGGSNRRWCENSWLESYVSTWVDMSLC